MLTGGRPSMCPDEGHELRSYECSCHTPRIRTPQNADSKRLPDRRCDRRISLFENKSVDDAKIINHKRKCPLSLKLSLHKRQAAPIGLPWLWLVLILVNLIGPLAKFNDYNSAISGHYISMADAALIIGDSAIEIQEVAGNPNEPMSETNDGSGGQVNAQPNGLLHQPIATFDSNTNRFEDPPSGPRSQSVILGSTNELEHGQAQNDIGMIQTTDSNRVHQPINEPTSTRLPSGPLPPLVKSEDITDGDKNSRQTHDYDLSELQQTTRDPSAKTYGDQNQPNEKQALNKVLAIASSDDEPDNYVTNGKRIAGKVVDFELSAAGGHNKAKLKKKKFKKLNKKLEASSEEAAKKWAKKKEEKKKAEEKKVSHHLKKKKEEAHKAKKKWGHQEHGQKKKGKFNKKKWGKKVKKGQGIKKGKKGRKFLKDKGHKNTGFKTVYHKEEWGNSNKWHDIKREKKWDEKAKKWKNKWNKEKSKKYKGEHMKKFENKKKEGKKYNKAKKEKSKKIKVEKYESGKKKKMEEHKKKKENGIKKEEQQQMKKKMKKKKKS